MTTDIIAELRSAAATLRMPNGGFPPLQDKVTAELLDRAATNMQHYQMAAEAEARQVDRLTTAIGHFTTAAKALVIEWGNRATNHLSSADPDDEDDMRLGQIMAGAVGGCAAQLGAALRSTGAPVAERLTWHTPDEKLPKQDGVRVLVHVQPAGSSGAVASGTPEGRQVFDVANFWTRPDGSPDCEKCIAGKVVRWAYIETLEASLC